MSAGSPEIVFHDIKTIDNFVASVLAGNVVGFTLEVDDSVHDLKVLPNPGRTPEGMASVEGYRLDEHGEPDTNNIDAIDWELITRIEIY
jgi:hypothetical protein